MLHLVFLSLSLASWFLSSTMEVLWSACPTFWTTSRTPDSSDYTLTSPWWIPSSLPILGWPCHLSFQSYFWWSSAPYWYDWRRSLSFAVTSRLESDHGPACGEISQGHLDHLHTLSLHSLSKLVSNQAKCFFFIPEWLQINIASNLAFQNQGCLN